MAAERKRSYIDLPDLRLTTDFILGLTARELRHGLTLEQREEIQEHCLIPEEIKNVISPELFGQGLDFLEIYAIKKDISPKDFQLFTIANGIVRYHESPDGEFPENDPLADYNIFFVIPKGLGDNTIKTYSSSYK